MARIDLSRYTEISEFGSEIGRDVSTIRQWIKDGMFDKESILIVGSTMYLKNTEIKNFKNSIVE